MSREVELLHPRLQGIIRQLRSEFPQLLITQTLRTVAEQDALYAQGRTKPGNIVTYVTGSSYSSQHQWGIAFDIAYNQSGNLYPDWFINQVAARAKELGCGWGGDWSGFVDKPHLYLPEWGSTTTKLKNTYGNFENFKKTWGSIPTPIVRKRGLPLMYRFYRNEKNGSIHWFDGTGYHVLAHPDEMSIINDVYRESTSIFTGTAIDVPCYTYTANAPWDVRLDQAACRKQEIVDLQNELLEVKTLLQKLIGAK